MPEGPEIRRSADALARVLEGRVLRTAEIGLASLKPHKQDVEGSCVLRVTSWGKAMLIHLENGLSIYSHNQLYGVWRVAKRGALPQTNRSLRLGLHTDTHSAVLYSASDISIWPTEQLCEQPLLSKLGPDVLADTLTKDALVARLNSARFRRRRLGALYLDQHFVAGIGNYLRSEILFFAGLHPDLCPKDLSSQALAVLAENTLAVAARSYQTAGYTVDDSFYNAAKRDNADFETSRFMVFDRENAPCRVCVTPIQRTERNGRRLYICPHCQPTKSETET